jgi:hypothetical protein
MFIINKNNVNVQSRTTAYVVHNLRFLASDFYSKPNGIC